MTQELFKLPPFITVILKKDGKILFLKRTNRKFFDNFFACPGGKVDGAESLLQAAKREVKEELGITINLEFSNVVHVCHFKREGNFEGLDFYIQAEKWDGQPQNKEPEKHSEIRWIDMNNLPDNIVSNHKKALEEIQKNVFYSEDGWE